MPPVIALVFAYIFVRYPSKTPLQKPDESLGAGSLCVLRCMVSLCCRLWCPSTG